MTVEGEVFEITKAVTFEAAHYMGGKPEGHPYRNVHGHSFQLEATVGDVYGVFTRGQARGKLELMETSAVAS